MTNELIFIVSTFVIFLFLRYCFSQGRRWLHTAIVINLILVSVFGAKLILLFGGETNVGNIFYAMVFFAGQLLVEHYGKDEAKKSVLLGFVSVAFFVVIGQLTVRYIGVPEGLAASSAIETLFQFTPRLAIASLIAYMFSQTINITLYGYLKEKRESKIWLRSLAAHAVGQVVDSIIFFSIAFLGTVSLSVLIGSIVTGFLVKLLVGISGIPFIYLSYRFRTKQEILEEEAEAILLSIGDGVVMTNEKGKILLVNDSFTRMLGWSRDEVLGTLATQILKRQDESGNDVPFEKRALTQVLRGKSLMTSVTNHSYFVRRDGSRFPVRIIVTPVVIDKKITGAVEIFQDVSKEKELEKMRTDFLSLASHHLRTPLSGTRWLIETLQSDTIGKLNPKQNEYLNDLYQVNNRMIQLVSDILNVLNIEAGTVSVNKEKILLSKVCGEVAIMMQAAAKEKGVILGKPLISEDLFVETDLQLAKTIIEVFVANAINYSHAGKEVKISAVEKGNEIIFSVKDEGIGIPKEEQVRIFERFYRASNAKVSKPNGTGLGLYIASILSEKIGAKISFESKEGDGSTFYLHFPKSSETV